ncbi:NUDIX domain-containing protein [Thalassospira marina]|uniref:DNA mismatch repair protein MutT n=1 Tax=Thalassospira marina TaxID=2048283 RepID=A0A2N3KUQ6_9PROT|nr:NUDIX domain-containing protein [Thalassospira marina]PKR54282.1 DNA mismatch repair protein MutT [Thalassospira marina]
MIGPIFGSPEPGKFYDVQDCAYAVIPDGNGRLGVVRTPKGIMLIGGGIERSETAKDALTREAVEETGRSIRIVSQLGLATQYVNNRAKGKYRLKRGVFFIAEIMQKTTQPIDLDHEFMWLPAIEVEQQLVRSFHKWAVQQHVRVTAEP